MKLLSREELETVVKEFNLELVDYKLLYGTSFNMPDYIQITAVDKFNRTLKHEFEYSKDFIDYIEDTLTLKQEEENRIVNKFKELEEQEIGTNEFFSFLTEENIPQHVVGEKGNLTITFKNDTTTVEMTTIHGDIHKITITSDNYNNQLIF